MEKYNQFKEKRRKQNRMSSHTQVLEGAEGVGWNHGSKSLTPHLPAFFLFPRDALLTKMEESGFAPGNLGPRVQLTRSQTLFMFGNRVCLFLSLKTFVHAGQKNSQSSNQMSPLHKAIGAFHWSQLYLLKYNFLT